MIWGLSLSEILKRMKCDTSASPLFQFKKSFKSYRVLIQRPNAIWGSNFKLGTIYTNMVSHEWHHLGMQNLMVCVTPFRGWFGGVCTRVGSTYVWEWAPGFWTWIICNWANHGDFSRGFYYWLVFKAFRLGMGPGSGGCSSLVLIGMCRCRVWK